MKIAFVFVALLTGLLLSAAPAIAADDAAPAVTKNAELVTLKINLAKGDVITTTYTSEMNIKAVENTAETHSTALFHGTQKCTVNEVTAEGNYAMTCNVVRLDGVFDTPEGKGAFDTDKPSTLSDEHTAAMAKSAGYNVPVDIVLSPQGKVVTGDVNTGMIGPTFAERAVAIGESWDSNWGSDNIKCTLVSANAADAAISTSTIIAEGFFGPGKMEGSLDIDPATGLYKTMKMRVSYATTAESSSFSMDFTIEAHQSK